MLRSKNVQINTQIISTDTQGFFAFSYKYWENTM